MTNNKPEKSVFLSKTIIGVLVMLAPVILELTGIDISLYLADGKVNVIEIIQIMGAILAIIGRLKAKKILRVIPNAGSKI